MNKHLIVIDSADGVLMKELPFLLKQTHPQAQIRLKKDFAPKMAQDAQKITLIYDRKSKIDSVPNAFQPSRIICLRREDEQDNESKNEPKHIHDIPIYYLGKPFRLAMLLRLLND